MANSFINKKADLTTTNLTTLYTVPSFKTAVIKSILVSEDAGSGANITVTLVDASSNIFSLFKTKAIFFIHSVFFISFIKDKSNTNLYQYLL